MTGMRMCLFFQLFMFTIASSLSPTDEMYLEYISSPDYKETIKGKIFSEECFNLLVSAVESPSGPNWTYSACEQSDGVNDGTIPNQLEISPNDFMASGTFLAHFETFLIAAPDKAPLLLYYLHTAVVHLSTADSYMSLLVGKLISQLHYRSLLEYENDARILVLIHLILVDLRDARIETTRSIVETQSSNIRCVLFPQCVRRAMRSALREKEEEILADARKIFARNVRPEFAQILNLLEEQIVPGPWPKVLEVVRSRILPSLLSISRVAFLELSFQEPEDNPTLPLLFELVSLVGGNSSPSYWSGIIRIIFVTTSYLDSTFESL